MSDLLTTKPMSRSEAARVAALARWGKYTPPARGSVINPRKAAAPARSRSGQRRAARRAGGGGKGTGGAARAAQQQRQAERERQRLARAAQRAADKKQRDAERTRAALQRDMQRTAREAKREMDRKRREEEKKKKGGGGKGKPDPAKQALANRVTVGKQLGIDLDALNTLATGGTISPAARQALQQRGLLGPDGQPTAAAVRALAAADRGDARATHAVLVAGQRADRQAADRRTQQQQRRQQQAQAAADRQRRQAAADIRRAAADVRRKKIQAIEDARREGRMQKSFTVYKAADGTPRWLTRTTTAYRDRDGEILSTAALDADSQRMMATKQFGPLRWWHLGRPDPGNPAAPWGPGLDVGTCDFSMVIGRTRVESGTFKSAALAQAVARIADRLELSPGFFHPPSEPDAGGVYTQMRTFERSLVPMRYARASNLYTGLTVKEFRMDPAEIEERFKAAIAELGLDAADATALGQQLLDTEKSAQAAGIAFKSTEHIPVYVAPDGTPGIIQDGQWVALKAATPPMADADTPAEVAETMAAGDDLSAEAPLEEEADGGEYVGDMTPEAFGALLAQALTTALQPLIKALDITGKMAGQVDELKSMFGATATKEAGRAEAIAALKAQQTELAARLAQLEGDAPAVTLAADVEAALKSDGPQAPAMPQPSFLNDPDRPMAGAAAALMPELYRAEGWQYGPDGWKPSAGG